MAAARPAPFHIALLRGINVGGKNKLAMRDLAAAFVEHGAGDVRTLIQSGNVVFRASARSAVALADRVAATIAERHGVRSPIVVRSAAELVAVTTANPFLRDCDPATLHVMFLRDRPSKSRIAALDPDRSPPDRFVVVGRDVFLHCPNGVARSKLTNAWLDAALDTVSTARNWNTVTKLVGMTTGD